MTELCVEDEDLKRNPANDEYEEDDEHHFNDLRSCMIFFYASIIKSYIAYGSFCCCILTFLVAFAWLVIAASIFSLRFFFFTEFLCGLIRDYV